MVNYGCGILVLPRNNYRRSIQCIEVKKVKAQFDTVHSCFEELRNFLEA